MSGISVFVVGVVLLSLGTTLPELVVSIESLKKAQPGIFFGNILGSLIVNSTLILGIVSIISPIEDGNLGHYVIALITFALTFLLFWLFTRTKHRLERWESIVLLGIYLIFVVVEFF
jgi:cation:H+ antiporter